MLFDTCLVGRRQTVEDPKFTGQLVGSHHCHHRRCGQCSQGSDLHLRALAHPPLRGHVWDTHCSIAHGHGDRPGDSVNQLGGYKPSYFVQE